MTQSEQGAVEEQRTEGHVRSGGTNKQADIPINKKTHKRTNKQTNTKTNRHANKQRDEQPKKQTNKQTLSEPNKQIRNLKVIQR